MAPSAFALKLPLVYLAWELHCPKLLCAEALFGLSSLAAACPMAPSAFAMKLCSVYLAAGTCTKL
jgi:hypothetical protein